MTTTREPCGCRSDGRQWLHFCVEHQQEHDTRAAAFAAHNVARSPGTRFTAEYLALAASHDSLPEFLQ